MPRESGDSRRLRRPRRVDGADESSSDEDVEDGSGRVKRRRDSLVYYPVYVGGGHHHHSGWGHHHAGGGGHHHPGWGPGPHHHAGGGGHHHSASQLCDSPGAAAVVGVIALVVCSAICTYFLAKEVKGAFADTKDRRGEVLLVSSKDAFDYGQYQQLAKKGVTIIMPREGEESMILHPDPREDGCYHEHRISNGELQELDFPETGHTSVLLSDQLSNKIDRKTGSNLLREHHRVNAAQRGWGTLMGAAAGVVGTGAAVAAAAALSALALTPVGWAVLACAAAPIIALACAKVGRWIGSMLMDQSEPKPKESRIFRDASASKAGTSLLPDSTPTYA
ncbi:hypothetical protein [Piscirickettsia salmonis]|uniref:hypothetical protein n=1 Tax=Piscirickettsia salmonis TaxID=1238 RepID=UPI0007C99005|nr:hypothetical protein A0O36_01418 [Piscirickettsiaceae bacterium NZ-RLO1]